MTSVNVKANTRVAILAALLVCAGLVISFVPLFCGGDILIKYQDKLFHLRRIAALSDTLQNGYFPARIYFAMSSGKGYALPVFYPDIFLYLPAFLYMNGVSLMLSYNVYVVILGIVTALVCYYSVYRMTDGNAVSAAVMSLAYTLSIYRLTNVYIRDAVGEYTAMAFLPLLIYAFHCVYTNEKEGIKEILSDAVLLGSAMALIGLSHILTTVISTAFLAVCAIILFKRTFSRRVLLRLLSSVPVFILLTLYFFVPMLDYFRADDYRVDQSTYSMRGFYPGLRELFEIIPSGSGSGIEFENRMPTAIGIALSVILLAWLIRAVAVSIDNVRKKKKFTGRFLAEAVLFFTAVAALFISGRYFPWELVESGHNIISRFFCCVQFSWRYIGIASAAAVALGGLLLDEIMKESRKKFIVISILMVMLSVIPGLILCIRNFRENEHARIDRVEQIGLFGDELYYPSVWNMDAVYEKEPVSSEGVVIKDFAIDKYKWTVNASSNEDLGCVVFPVVYYKGYETAAADSAGLQTMQATDGRVMVIVPKGFDGEFTLEFREPFIWRVSEVISLISFICVICMLFCRRKKR